MKKDSVSIAVIANATVLPLAAGVVLQWYGQSGECQEVGPNSLLVQGQHAPFQIPGPLPAHHASPYWTTREIGRVPVISLPLRAWEKEATRLTFSLAQGLLVAPRPAVLAGVTDDLVWGDWRWQSSATHTGQRPEALS
jgi:hypothetical protein